MSHRGGLGVGGRRLRAGGVTECVCPKCGTSVPHQKGVPCSTKRCPRCGTSMTGAW